MMESRYAVAASSVAAAVLLHYLLMQWRRRKEPPGPWGLPLIGYLPFLKLMVHETAKELREKYGDVISIPLLFGNRFVIVQGYETIREGLVSSGDAFNGRYSTFREQLLNPHMLGIATSEGAESESLRRFSLRTLKNFGLGRAESERIILQEFEQLKTKAVTQEGQSVNPRLWVNKAVALVTCKFVFGDTIDYDSPEFDEYLSLVSLLLRYNLNLNPLNALLIRIPLLLRLTPQSFSNAKKVSNAMKKLLDFNRDQIHKHMQQLNQKSEPADFTDAFLMEQKRRGSDKDDLFSDAHLLHSLNQLFIAGSDTTTTTLNWALVLMAVHSDVQEKVHSELASVIGLGREPHMQDRPRTPYTDAVLHELQRYCSIAPFALPHSPMWDSKLKGFDIRKGTLVAFCLHSVHFDPKLWARPNEFYPEHFLDSTGTKLKACEYLIPFGLGRRACMGEALAKMELYLFFSSLFLNFKVTLADNQPHSLDDILRGNTDGGILCPLDFNVRFQLR